MRATWDALASAETEVVVGEPARGRRELDDLFGRLGADPHGGVCVEVGCGPGRMTGALAERFERVLAVDVSPAMLRALRAKAAGAGAANVEVVRAGFLTYDHAGERADVVYSRYALHHLPDFWKAVALVRIRRMLRPGGVLRLWDVVYRFAPDEAEDRVEKWCATGSADAESEPRRVGGARP